MTYFPVAQVVAAAQTTYDYIAATSAVVTVSGSLIGSLLLTNRVFRSKIKNQEINATQGISRTEEIRVIMLDYYRTSLIRANITLGYSILLGSLGFGLIIFPIITKSNGSLSEVSLKVFSGFVIDVVSGLSLLQYSSTQKIMSECLENLRLDCLHTTAIELLTKLENKDLRDKSIAEMISRYSDVKSHLREQ